MSLAIEAAELMEHFQWIDADESRRVGDDPAKLAAIRDEIADVMCYILALANALDIDLSQAVRGKMVKNAAKYPAEQSRGRYDPPTPYELGKDLFGGDPSGRPDLSQNSKQIVGDKLRQRNSRRNRRKT
jgi:NTP pyrophosphatase (non-canonical NTP hydrolase)